MTFTTAVLILFTSLCISQMCNWSVIHGIKRKPHLSVVWNWYHFVAIAIFHQPRPTDSADINTRLQLSDTSSKPPMHGGFLLIYMYCISYCLLWYHMHNMTRNWWFHFILSILIHRWNTKINCLNTIPSSVLLLIMMTSSNGKKSALLTLCSGIHRSPVNSPHEGQWRRALVFSLIYAWINDWANSGEAGDLRRHRTHYDVTVMKFWYESVGFLPLSMEAVCKTSSHSGR